MVYRLIVSYCGGAYAGWQRQDNALAVQQVVEEALAALLGTDIALVGAGRTDAGVHARAQAAHLELAVPAAPSALIHGTNARLPDDIRVMAAERMAEGFHARKSAMAKRYAYRLIDRSVLSPLDAPFAIRLPRPFSLDRVREAVALLPGRHDFTAFALAGGAHRQPRRTLHAAGWERRGDEHLFQVVGEGFLRGMVRSLVGTLLDVGRGRFTVDDFRTLLAGRPRSAAGPTAPARGLVLERVFYPEPWGPPWPAPPGEQSRGSADDVLT